MRQTGFTLIEVTVTAAIIALLATIAFPMVEVVVQRGKEQDLRTALKEMREAIDAYKQASDEGHILNKVGESGYPASLQVLVDGVEDAKNPDTARHRLYFLRRIPRDPFFPDKTVSPDKTWGLRSYASPPDAPKAGEDVFDVYSLTPGVGLDGIPYREW